MAKKMTSKTPLFGNRRSHACNATRHAQRPNYQKVTLVDGSGCRKSRRYGSYSKRIKNYEKTK